MSLTPDTGLWLSISDLAVRKGVTKQTVAERVGKLEAQGLIQTHPGKGRAKMVNLAAYDKAVGDTGDAIRQAAAAPRKQGGDENGDPVLAKEQARRVAFQADIAELDLNERLGKLLPVEQVEASMVLCAETISRALDQMTARADELAAAVAKEGTNGARSFLKIVARDVRSLLAREMRLLATTENEEGVETEDSEE